MPVETPDKSLLVIQILHNISLSLPASSLLVLEFINFPNYYALVISNQPTDLASVQEVLKTGFARRY